MHIIIIRHGESYSNTQGRMMSWTDLSLTERGREQARSAGPFIKGLAGEGGFGYIFSSDFKRAYETTQIASGSQRIKTTELLREMNLGLLEGMTWEERYSRYGDISLETGLSEAVIPGGESFEELKSRCERFISEYLDPIKEEDAYVLLGTHGICMRTLTNVLLGQQDKLVNCINWPDNTSVTEIVYDTQKQKKPELVRLNDRTHLKQSGLGGLKYEEECQFAKEDYCTLIQ